MALFQLLNISHLVVKNAGGAAARTKLDAAGRLSIPIIIVSRPAEPDAAPARLKETLRDWLTEVGAI